MKNNEHMSAKAMNFKVTAKILYIYIDVLNLKTCITLERLT